MGLTNWNEAKMIHLQEQQLDALRRIAVALEKMNRRAKNDKVDQAIVEIIEAQKAAKKEEDA